MLYCFFGPILSYVQNCIPLNFMYPEGQPLYFIKNKKYFYSYGKLYQQLKNTLNIICFTKIFYHQASTRERPEE